MIRRLSLATALLAATLAIPSLATPALAADAAAHPTGLHVVGRIPGPDGGWDYASFDPARRRVYITHGDVVIAIDADTGKLDPAFATGSHLHAAVPVPGTDVVVTTNSGDNTARIVSAKDGHLLASIPTADDADGAAYDPKSGLVVVICGDAGALTLIDPKAMKAVGTINVGDTLEFGQPDGKGLFYVNVEDKNQVAVVDLAARKVLRRYDLTDCKRPTGLAYVAGHRVISACGDGGVNILDAASGKLIAKLQGRRLPRRGDLRRRPQARLRPLGAGRRAVRDRPRRPRRQHHHRHHPHPARRPHRHRRSQDRPPLPADRRVQSPDPGRPAPDNQAGDVRGAGGVDR